MAKADRKRGREVRGVLERVQVSCINKSARSEFHQRIWNLGGQNSDGSVWKLSESEAIAGIDARRWSFFVERAPGDDVDVVIASRLSARYLETTADGDSPDVLLALPECP
jgi:hypothetical protein